MDVQGLEIEIDVYASGSALRVDFCNAQTKRKFLEAGRTGVNPWSELLRFANPLAALTQIGKEVLSMTGGKMVWLEGCDEKRTRVYKKLLERAGVPHALRIDDFGDLCIAIGE